MTPAARATRTLTTWLHEKAGYAHVRRLVQSAAIPRMGEGALAIYLGQSFSSVPEDLAEEMTQEFLVYLLEHFLPRLDDHPDLVTAILNGQIGKVLRQGLTLFLWRLRDAARKKDINPRAYLYRRAREALGQDSGFILAEDGRSYWLADGPDPPVRDPAVFAGLEYSRWPVPPEPETRDALFTIAHLITAARLFYRLLANRLGLPIAVPVRELVRYLAAHHGWLDRLPPHQLADDLPLAAEIDTMEEQVGRTMAMPSIAVLAVQFAMGMDETARRIFYWRLGDPPLPFREIAERLGLPDHNRTYRIYSQTEKALRKFVSHWSGPPLAELPDDVGLAFIEELRKICKRSVSWP